MSNKKLAKRSKKTSYVSSIPAIESFKTISDHEVLANASLVIMSLSYTSDKLTSIKLLPFL